jgi:peptidoglycan/LPS O-acetylase OafA/YrhL
MSDPPRFHELDSLRGLAALIVVVGHFAAMFHPAMVFGHGPPGGWESLFSSTPLHLLCSGHFAVCLFFILSGFVLSVRTFTPGSPPPTARRLLVDILRRPLRLIGVVLGSVLISLFLWRQGWFFNQEVSQMFGNTWLSMFWKDSPPENALSDLAMSPFFEGARYNAPLWTIVLELYGSWMVLGITWLLARLPKGRMFLLLLAIIAMRQVPKCLTACGYDHTLVPAAHWHLLQGFLIGVMMALVWHARPQWMLCLWRSRSFRSGWLSLALFLASVPAYAPHEGPWFGLLPSLPAELAGGPPMLGAAMLFAAVLGGLGRGWLQRPALVMLGRLSYAIYGCHFIVQGSAACLVYLRMNQAGYAMLVCSTVSFVAMSIITAGAAILLHWSVDRLCIRASSVPSRSPSKRDEIPPSRKIA